MHIVVVDPSRVVLKIISGVLASRGHIVSCFTNSRDALEFVARDQTVSGLITSLEVQPICGFELCWSARLLAQAHRGLYIIAMSSAQSARNLSEALDSGADDFISKPPVPEELHARLRAAERLTFMQSELIKLAETDPLTGLYNRRAFFSRLQQSIESQRPRGSLSFVMFDIDHFKSINDGYGHDIGDQALKAVAQEVTLEGLTTGRLGGEEFGIICASAQHSAAYELSDKLRMRLSALQIQTPDKAVQLTCSFGVSDWSDSDTIDTLVKRADLALYEAKASGRNCVVVR
jgi:diguanylate cyclase (GGDEF)-like protein